MHPSIKNSALLGYVAERLRRMKGVAEATVVDDGCINVVLSKGIDRRLRQEALDVGKRAMVPVRVFYRMPDGRTIGEGQLTREAIEDYYTPIYVNGFAGCAPEAPADEVAGEKDGALKLKRIRSASRGRPVVGWRYGDKTVRRGSEIEFKQGCSLAWTMGRSMNVRKGAVGRITDLSTKRPVAYIALGDYEGIELPVHMLGTVFDISGSKDQKVESKKKPEKKAPIDSNTGYLGPEFKRLIMAVGFGRVPGQDDTDRDSPNWVPDGSEMDGTDSPDPYIPPAHEGEEDMISSPEAMDPSQPDDRFIQRAKKSNKPKLVLGRK